MALMDLLVKVGVVGAVIVLTSYVVAYLSSPLKQLPGPFLAKFTNWWRFWNHYTQTHIETQQKLHKKYGKYVRLGPNVVSISDPNLIKRIYDTRGNFVKSDYYSINDAKQGPHIIPNLFSTRSNEFHSKTIRPVQKLYAFPNTYQIEHLMDKTIRVLCTQLEERFMEGSNAGKTCDLADWVSFYAWDILGETTFSKRIGFLEAGEDLGNMLKSAESVMRYFSVIGQMPALDQWLGKNDWCPIKFPDFSIAAGQCVDIFMERMKNLQENPEAVANANDFMNGFLKAKEEFPESVTDNEVIGYLILNILGGADTTAIVQKAIFYWILKNPSAHKKLVEELDAAKICYPPTYDSVSHLPWLEACIKEGMRMHPVVGHILERIVPATGLQLNDASSTVLPPGTTVGVNPWVTTRDESIVGENPEEFRPERWLQGKAEGKEEFEERLKKMKDADLTFGQGSRTCLGRPLAIFELFKVTSTLFGKYDMQLQQDWTINKQWFVWPHNIKIKISPREAGKA
ncbi:cytochrome P450 [Delitschia confertaspora ATCC 74209]|uniref:Cytochrome P450 n=1 Tax=Delitschia confertaspora ATCC 74209 TaxID=1513339 RepID=A0A9P4JMY9_9PLEO|nr:cytochrome P450 [Delitschia confertaspora ATCC 74209]